ncbi:hypothetical protein ACFOYU_03955 [Microvirga sp. GCM10011540]|uniref:hypothetical protein n=1 Tax=Microvirga sp. GCM10011540 TaxID=3317338 RepID=UPI003609EB66
MTRLVFFVLFSPVDEAAARFFAPPVVAFLAPALVAVLDAFVRVVAERLFDPAAFVERAAVTFEAVLVLRLAVDVDDPDLRAEELFAAPVFAADACPDRFAAEAPLVRASADLRFVPAAAEAVERRIAPAAFLLPAFAARSDDDLVPEDAEPPFAEVRDVLAAFLAGASGDFFFAVPEDKRRENVVPLDAAPLDEEPFEFREPVPASRATNLKKRLVLPDPMLS